MDILANSKDPDEMLHYAAKGSISSGSTTLFAKTKSIFRERNTIFLQIITSDLFNIYNGQSRLYCM